MNSSDNKIERFLDMQEHPENYSASELKAMLDDADMQEFIHHMTLAKRAVISSDTAKHARPRAEEEWKKFDKRHFSTSTRHRMPIRVAAVFAGAICLSGIAYATFRLTSTPEKHPATVCYTEKQTSASTGTSAVETVNIQKDTLNLPTVVYEEAELKTILTDISAWHGVRIEFRNTAVQHLRLHFVWNKKQTLEQTVELLNGFESFAIKVENKVMTVE